MPIRFKLKYIQYTCTINQCYYKYIIIEIKVTIVFNFLWKKCIGPTVRVNIVLIIISISFENVCILSIFISIMYTCNSTVEVYLYTV